MNFSFDSWPWKFALIIGLLAAREFVRLFSPKAGAQNAGGNGRWLIETIDSATIAIGLVLFVIQPFIVQAFYIPTGSMENTLPPGDRILASKLLYYVRAPQRGDAIVFRPPPEAHPDKPDDVWIKRCIGVPGDRVSMRGRLLTLNGQTQSEPYTYWDAEPNHIGGYDMKIVGGVVYSREYVAGNTPDMWRRNGVVVSETLQARLERAQSEPIPAGKLLMLGDHRNDSDDGHEWGLLDEKRIMGKAICVFWPGTRLGLVDRISKLSVPETGRETAPRATAVGTTEVKVPAHANQSDTDGSVTSFPLPPPSITLPPTSRAHS